MNLALMTLVLTVQTAAVPTVTEGDKFRMPPVSYICDAPGTPRTANGALQWSTVKVNQATYFGVWLMNPSKTLIDDAKLESVKTLKDSQHSTYEMTLRDRNEPHGTHALKIELVPGSSEAKIWLVDGATHYDGWSCFSPPAPPRPRPKWAEGLAQ